MLQHEDLATIVLRDDALDAEARAQLDTFYEQIIALIGQAVRVGHRLGIARECDEQIIAVSALGGLKESLTRMLAAHRAPESAPGSRDRAAGTKEPADGDFAASSAVVAAASPSSPRPSTPSSPLADPDRLADELLRFFVRGVFTQDTR